MPNVIVDTGVWISFADKRDRPVSDEAIENIIKYLKPHSIIFLWPIAYETLRTRMVRKKSDLKNFEDLLSSLKLEWIDDSAYRMDALDLTFSSAKRGRELSMVDCLIRIFISDRKNKVDNLLTFNDKDFHDVCAANRVNLLTGKSDWT